MTDFEAPPDDYLDIHVDGEPAPAAPSSHRSAPPRSQPSPPAKKQPAPPPSKSSPAPPPARGDGGISAPMPAAQRSQQQRPQTQQRREVATACQWLPKGISNFAHSTYQRADLIGGLWSCFWLFWLILTLAIKGDDSVSASWGAALLPLWMWGLGMIALLIVCLLSPTFFAFPWSTDEAVQRVSLLSFSVSAFFGAILFGAKADGSMTADWVAVITPFYFMMAIVFVWHSYQIYLQKKLVDSRHDNEDNADLFYVMKACFTAFPFSLTNSVLPFLTIIFLARYYDGADTRPFFQILAPLFVVHGFHIINGVMFADKYLPVTAFLVPLGLLPLIGEAFILMKLIDFWAITYAVAVIPLLLVPFVLAAFIGYTWKQRTIV